MYSMEAVNKNHSLCPFLSLASFFAIVHLLMIEASHLGVSSCNEVQDMWHLWRLRPRPLWPPWRWPWRYYAWRLETYTGIPASEVTWQTFLTFFRQSQYRHAFWRYVRWLRQMRRLRHLEHR